MIIKWGCFVQVGNDIELEARLVSSSNPTGGPAPLWCDLSLVPNSRGNKAAGNPRPNTWLLTHDY